MGYNLCEAPTIKQPRAIFWHGEVSDKCHQLCVISSLPYAGECKIDRLVSGGCSVSLYLLCRAKREMLTGSSIFSDSCACLNLCMAPHIEMTLCQIWPGGRLDEYLSLVSYHFSALCWGVQNWSLGLRKSFPQAIPPALQGWVDCVAPEAPQEENADEAKHFLDQPHMNLDLCMAPHVLVPHFGLVGSRINISALYYLLHIKDVIKYHQLRNNPGNLDYYRVNFSWNAFFFFFI